MSYDKQKVIDWAKKQVGYKETPDNINKYAEYLDKLTGFYNGKKNGFAWCDVFVDDGFVESYGRTGAQFLLCQPDNSAGAGCQYSAAYFNAKGQFYKSNPQPGDQIFFGSSWQNVWHTGLVISVNNGYVTTIEGNSNNMVAERRYSVSDKNIWGYGRPKWGEDEHTEPVQELPKICTIDLPVLQIGAKSEAVRAAQYLLKGRGFSVGWAGCDGDFGRQTESAVGKFQKDRKLTCDGVIGRQTWEKLIKD